MTIICFLFLSVIFYRVIPKPKQILTAYVIGFLMSVIAFYMTEKNQHDLTVYREVYDTLQNGGIMEAMSYSVVDRSPLFIWIVYFMSYLEDNRFTSAIPTFIGYFILIFIFVQTSLKFDIRKTIQIVCVTFLMFILPWQDYSVGVRGALAYSLCSLGVYLEFRNKNKLLGLFFYVFPLFIHQASIIFLVLRLFIFFMEIFPSSRKIIYVLCLFLGGMTELMGPLIENLANLTGIRILAIISNSFNSYAVEGKELYEIRVVLLRVTALLIIYFCTRKYINRNTESKAEFHIYSIFVMLMLLSIGFIWQYDIICRYSVACMIFSSLILYRCSPKYVLFMILFAIFNLISYYDSYYCKFEILFQ